MITSVLQPLFIAKSAFFINNRGFTDGYIIVMLHDSASFHRLITMFTLAFTFRVTNFHTNWQLG